MNTSDWMSEVLSNESNDNITNQRYMSLFMKLIKVLWFLNLFVYLQVKTIIIMLGKNNNFFQALHDSFSFHFYLSNIFNFDNNKSIQYNI